jgi:flavin-dependent dehydrogenase
MSKYDAVVIGGGPAGSTCAVLLARAGWSVALVEKAAFPRRKVCGEFLSATNLPLLRDLGVDSVFGELSGPEVRRVGLFTRNRSITADMPKLADEPHGWGRALGREHLDTMLLERAAAEGADVWQPWGADELHRIADGYDCAIVSGKTRETTALRARVAIAAHGSWEPGQLPTQPHRRAPRGSDLFGFKAHFLDCRLPSGLMPLLAFPGGYGGMVHSDHGRVSLSCCVRRDTLEACRRSSGGSAGESVLAHLKASCHPVRDALERAVIDGDWRSAGPIRPGIRSRNRDGVFLVGNAAGEAHPAVAEGISMAMQSAWLAAHHLIAGTGDEYASAWHRMFASRIYASAAIAHWAMRPAAVVMSLPLLQAFPAVLTEGARTTGKVTAICSPSF